MHESRRDYVVRTITTTCALHEARELGAFLRDAAGGTVTSTDPALLRLAWLTHVYQTAASSGGLFMNAMSMDLLVGGAMPVSEFLESVRLQCAGPAFVAADSPVPTSMRWSANYWPNLLTASVEDLAALITIPLSELRGAAEPQLRGARPEVLAWVRGHFHPRSAEEHVLYAQAVGATDPERGRQLLQGALTLEPRCAAAHAELGLLAALSDDWVGAREHLVQARAFTTTPDVAVLRLAAEAEQHNGAYGQAEAILTEALQLRPQDYGLLRDRACARGQLGNGRGAVEDLDQAVRLEPDDPEVYYNRGLAKAMAGDQQGGLADYDRALELEPDHARALNNRGLLKRDMGDLQGGIDDITEALACPEATHVWSRINRAALFAAAARHAEAIEDLTYAIVREPHRSLFNRRATSLEALGVHWRAISDSVTVLRVSSHADAEAVASQQRLQRLGYTLPADLPFTHNPEALVQQGRQLGQRGDSGGEQQQYEAALAIDPGSSDALYNLAVAKSRAGELDVAMNLYERAIQVNPSDYQARLNRGTLFLEQAIAIQNRELWMKAAADFGAAAAVEPLHPRAYIKLGAMQLSDGLPWGALVLNLVGLATLEREHPDAAVVERIIQAQIIPALGQAPAADGLRAAEEIFGTLMSNDAFGPVVSAAQFLDDTVLRGQPEILAMMAIALWHLEDDRGAQVILRRACAASPERTAAIVERLIKDCPLNSAVRDLLTTTPTNAT